MNIQTIQSLLAAGSEAFTEQLIKMENEKVIAPYYLIDHQRVVIELYKTCFENHIKALPVDATAIMEAQKAIDFAIDQARIHNLPTEELQTLKNDIHHLKYDLL